MKRALALAASACGCTSPNPLVGCVVVRDNEVLGEGCHERHGHAHAEINALKACAGLTSHDWNPPDSTPLPTMGATMYVTLEPCNHFGLTSPCTDAIIAAGISHVVYALADPNPRAAGGAEKLQALGVKVTHGVLEAEARFQNRFFLKSVMDARPYVIVKSATSLDGRIATREGHSQWITGPDARLRGHELRQAVDAIIVGANTVIADNPSLTVRLPESLLDTALIRHPRPVVLDSSGRVPLESRLLNGSLPTRTLVATTDRMSPEHRRKLESRGNEVLCLPVESNGFGIAPSALLDALHRRDIQSVLVEGGASVQGSFRDADLVDEVWCFLAPVLIGGQQACPAFTALGSASLDDATTLGDVQVETLGSDLLVRACVTRPGTTAGSAGMSTTRQASS